MTLLFTISIFGIMLFLTFTLAGVVNSFQESQARELLASAEKKLLRELNPVQGKLDIAELKEQEKDLAFDHLRLQVTDKDGKIIFPEGNDLRPRIFALDKGYRSSTLTVGENKLLIYMSWGHQNELYAEYLFVFVLMTFIVTIASAVGAWILIGRTLSPIDKLAQQASSVSANLSDIRLVAPSKDAEMTRLVDTLNGLLERISEDALVKSRFYAAASHELRTPLQALSGHLELSLTRPRSREEYHEVVEEASAQAQRLSRLVSDLLQLNQLEAGRSTPIEKVDLTEICANRLGELRQSIADKKLTVSIDLPKEVSQLATRNYLETLVRNLLENAVKYCDAGGQVAISFETVNGKRRLSISNSFTATTPVEIQYSFEPFFRPDSSRNSSTGGNGLGLAICKSICEASGWTMDMKQTGAKVIATVSFETLVLLTQEDEMSGC